MRTRIVAVALACATLVPITAEARVNASTPFWSGLDHDGVLSAGWVQVLPVLASACKLKLDSRELNAKLVDISETTRNSSYATDLYWHLFLMDRHKAKNAFVHAWKARFGDNQKDACDTAETLWGNAGQQFPGVLKREVAFDSETTSTIPNAPAPNCR
jgi:hypothetical protein